MTASRSPPAGGTREAARFECGEEGTVVVRKLVSKGERLAIADEDDEIKLDALLLESISWQSDRRVLADVLADRSIEDPFPAECEETDPEAPELSISNEYSRAVVTRVQSDGREGVLIRAPARGTSIALGVPTLSALAGLEDTFAFSEWFKTPFGPEDAPLEGPL